MSTLSRPGARIFLQRRNQSLRHPVVQCAVKKIYSDDSECFLLIDMALSRIRTWMMISLGSPRVSVWNRTPAPWMPYDV